MKAIKRLGLIFIMIFLLLSTINVFASEPSKAYVVPIKGEINRATHNYVRDVMNDLNNMDVEAIIFEIDTYGGLVDEAIKIKDIILSTNIPTIAFVNNKAASAGVLITIAGEHIVMSENAVIGSAETEPDTEKILSMWRGVLRDTAQFRDRDPLLLESMADRDIEIEGVIKKGKLLNLTAKEAKELGLADLLSSDYNEMLDEFGIKADSIELMEEGLQVKLSKYVASPYISTMLLTLGFVGLVVEILTPGFGLGGTISLMGFGLYFAGNILAGNSNWTSLVLFIVGLGLLVIEGIVPGFGLPGIGGIVFILTGVALAMDSLSAALLSLSIAIIITTLVAIVMVKLGFKSKLLGKITLTNKLESEKGYLSTNTMSALINLEGTSLTELRPSGFIIIDSQKYDALAESGYIPKDTAIKVVKVEGSKIFVRRNI